MLSLPQKRNKPRLIVMDDDWEPPVVRPPDTVYVEEAKPVLFTADGKPMVRRIGY